MEIRNSTISFTKGKSKLQRERELLVKDQLDELDRKICSNDDLQNIDQELKRYETMKKELQSLYMMLRVKLKNLHQNVVG